MIKTVLIRTDNTHSKRLPSDFSSARSNFEEKTQNVSDCYQPSLKNLKDGTLRNMI